MERMDFEQIIDRLSTNAREAGVPILRSESRELLLETAKKAEPKTILEFGTAVGVSSILLHSVTGAKVDTIELDPERANEARANIAECGVSDAVAVFVGDALEISNQLLAQNKTYDFVFLDSAKGQYIKLLPNILKLLNPHGVLFADNVLFRGYVYGECPKRFKTIAVRLKQFIEACQNCKELTDAHVINVEDGVLIAKKV